MNAAALPDQRSFGEHLRQWRQRRRWSQLDLASEADISARHLSFVETGRSAPSRDMVLRLAERLDIPLRERNTLLVAAGYAPMYRERPFHDAALAGAREAVERLLAAHEPYPALAVDRHWNLIAANRMLHSLLTGVADATLLQPPVNVLRLSLHPHGIAPRIQNFSQWRSHLLDRLHHQATASGDAQLGRLLVELQGYPAPAQALEHEEASPVAVPLRLRTEQGTLSLISTTTVFGTPTEVTLQELALETFLPADAATATLLRTIAEAL